MQETTVDQQFIEYIARSLVDNEADVKVERIVDERGVLLTLFVNPADLGRVIGKRGVIAESLRTLLRSLGIKNNAHYNLKIADTDGGQGSLNQKDLSLEQNPNRESSELNSEPRSMYDYSRPNRTPKPEVENSVQESTVPTEEAPSEESDFVKNTRQELADLED
jgi:predicted RNA-binding protein YlqC (UPF0109 family)